MQAEQKVVARECASDTIEIVHEIINKSERKVAKCTRSGANDAKTVPKITQKRVCFGLLLHIGLSFG
jgi:hypothetical protein